MTADYREGRELRGAARCSRTCIDRPGRAGGAARAARARGRADELGGDTPEHWVAVAGGGQEGAAPAGPRRQGAALAQLHPPLEIPDDFVGAHEPRRAGGAGPLHQGARRGGAVAVHGPDGGGAGGRARARGCRPPTRSRRRWCRHEKTFREDILGEARWAWKPREIPPLHIGEFGVGRGGLSHPNLWAGDATPEQEKALAREIARGHEGLMRYLARPDGRTAGSAVLWVTGRTTTSSAGRTRGTRSRRRRRRSRRALGR